jgi:hypothetical protein
MLRSFLLAGMIYSIAFPFKQGLVVYTVLGLTFWAI